MKRSVYILLFLLIPFLGDAQRWKHERLSIIVSTGNSYFLGDLGGGSKDASHYLSFRDVDWQLTRPAFQAGVRYRILQELAGKMAGRAPNRGKYDSFRHDFSQGESA